MTTEQILELTDDVMIKIATHWPKAAVILKAHNIKMARVKQSDSRFGLFFDTLEASFPAFDIQVDTDAVCLIGDGQLSDFLAGGNPIKMDEGR